MMIVVMIMNELVWPMMIKVVWWVVTMMSNCINTSSIISLAAENHFQHRNYLSISVPSLLFSCFT